jgi:hypothetical protein
MRQISLHLHIACRCLLRCSSFLDSIPRLFYSTVFLDSFPRQFSSTVFLDSFPRQFSSTVFLDSFPRQFYSTVRSSLVLTVIMSFACPTSLLVSCSSIVGHTFFNNRSDFPHFPGFSTFFLLPLPIYSVDPVVHSLIHS